MPSAMTVANSLRMSMLLYAGVAIENSGPDSVVTLYDNLWSILCSAGFLSSFLAELDLFHSRSC